MSSWSRYDTYGGRTVYTASTRGCAFDEVLAGFRRRLGAGDSLARDAAAVGLSVAEFLRAVDEDWAELGVMLPGWVCQVWMAPPELEIPGLSGSTCDSPFGLFQV